MLRNFPSVNALHHKRRAARTVSVPLLGHEEPEQDQQNKKPSVNHYVELEAARTG